MCFNSSMMKNDGRSQDEKYHLPVNLLSLREREAHPLSHIHAVSVG